MATMFYDKDTDIDLIRQKKVAVIGYGSQGHAHALNLQDSGVEVVVGLQAGSKSADKAKAAGLKVLSVADASKWADVVMVLIPDQHQAKVYKADIAPHLTAGKMLMFAHGFAIRFNWIVPPANVDVTMVAPKAPGHRVREVFKEGAGTPGLLLVGLPGMLRLDWRAVSPATWGAVVYACLLALVVGYVIYNRAVQAIGHLGRAIGLAQAAQHHHEFVAAHAAERRAGHQVVADALPAGSGHEHLTRDDENELVVGHRPPSTSRAASRRDRSAAASEAPSSACSQASSASR